MVLRAWIPAFASLTLAACGGTTVDFEATFPDELLEAPARTVDIVAVIGGDCEELLSVPHDQLSSVATIHVRRQTAYPVDPDSRVLEGVPSGVGVALDVAAYDDVPQQIARNCQVVVITPGEDSTITMPMLGLPSCTKEPTSLDLVMIVDASLRTSIADIAMESALIERLKGFVNSGFSQGTTFTLISHGPSDPTTVVARTAMAPEIDAGLDAIGSSFNGMGAPYAALTYASTLLRARAVCGSRPVIMTIGSDTDPGLPGAFQEAALGVFSAQGDPNDDIFVAAISLTGDASSVITTLFGADYNENFGASTLPSLNGALSAVKVRLQGLISLVN